MRILIIDDEVEVAKMLAEAVTSQGHVTTLAHHGEEGLAMLERDPPDAVFLDVVMPDMSGIEVLRRIRSTDEGLPVVLITGHAQQADLDEARRLGVTEIVVKPLGLKYLEKALANVKPLDGEEKSGRRVRSPKGQAPTQRPDGN